MLERGEELRLPWPPGGHAECHLAGGAGHPTGDGEEPASQRAGGGDHRVGQPDQGRPPQEVVRERGDHGPGGVGEELAGGEVRERLETRSTFRASTCSGSKRGPSTCSSAPRPSCRWSRRPLRRTCARCRRREVLNIAVTAETSASPEEVLALAGTDFSACRAEIWPNVTTRRLEVHRQGDGFAEVTEGATGIAWFAWSAASTSGPSPMWSTRRFSTPTCSSRAPPGSSGSRRGRAAAAA